MRYLSVALLVFVLAGCQSSVPPQFPRHGTVIHVVICWLKDAGDPSAHTKLIDASHGFADIPGVVRVQAGDRLSLATTRPIDDQSFDVAIVMTFYNADALKQYQSNPEHQAKLREVLMPLTRKVIVYDAVDMPSDQPRK